MTTIINWMLAHPDATGIIAAAVGGAIGIFVGAIVVFCHPEED